MIKSFWRAFATNFILVAIPIAVLLWLVAVPALIAVYVDSIWGEPYTLLSIVISSIIVGVVLMSLVDIEDEEPKK